MTQVIFLIFNALAPFVHYVILSKKYRNSCTIEQQKALQLLILSLNFDAVALV